MSHDNASHGVTGVAVVADLHVAKMEAARLACGEAEAAAGTCEA